MSLNQWIAAAVAEKVGVVETAADFFKKRAGKAAGEGLMKFSSHRAQTRGRTGRYTPIATIKFLTTLSHLAIDQINLRLMGLCWWDRLDTNRGSTRTRMASQVAPGSCGSWRFHDPVAARANLPFLLAVCSVSYDLHVVGIFVAAFR